MHAQHRMQWQWLQPCTFDASHARCLHELRHNRLDSACTFCQPKEPMHRQAWPGITKTGECKCPRRRSRAHSPPPPRLPLVFCLDCRAARTVPRVRQNCHCESRFELRALLPAREGTRAARQRLGTACEGWEGRVPTENLLLLKRRWAGTIGLIACALGNLSRHRPEAT